MKRALISLFAVTTVAGVSCDWPSDTVDHFPAALNEPCVGPADCADGLACGTDGESAEQCVIENCPSAGAGPDHGCPEGSFCYVFDEGEGHYCTRVCDSDSDCQAINPDLVCDERTATESSGLRICVLAEQEEPEAALNRACDGPDDCDSPLVCGSGGESDGQCVIEGCSSAGPGTAHGCPEGSFCYVFDGDDGHYCTRTCQADIQCTLYNPNLVCRERTATEPFGLSICVLP